MFSVFTLNIVYMSPCSDAEAQKGFIFKFPARGLYRLSENQLRKTE